MVQPFSILLIMKENEWYDKLLQHHVRQEVLDNLLTHGYFTTESLGTIANVELKETIGFHSNEVAQFRKLFPSKL